MSSCYWKAQTFSCLGAWYGSSWSSYVLKQVIPWHVFLFLFVYINLFLPVHENHKHFIVWEHVVSAHWEATALNRESIGMFFCFYLFTLILCLPFYENHKKSCLGSCCVGLWSSYGLKQVIPWLFFLFIFVYIDFMYLCSWKAYTFLVWENVVPALGSAAALNREYLGIFFVSLCLYWFHVFLLMKRIIIFWV